MELLQENLVVVRLNKRLLMPAIVLLSAFNILPIGVLSVDNFDPLKVLMLAILLFSLVRFRGYFTTDVRFATLFFLTIFLSAIFMMLRGKYVDWTFFYCLNYLNLFLLLLLFKDVQDLHDYVGVLIFLCIVASLIHFIFFIRPSLLNGVLTDIRMGSLNMDATKVRVFIPGMGFIAVMFSFLVTKLIYFRRLGYIDLIALTLFFCSIFIFASVRTYSLGLIVALSVLLLCGKLKWKNILFLIGAALVLLLIMFLAGGETREYITNRFDIFLKLGNFQLMDVLRLEVDYESEQTFGTIYFRIMEVIYVLNNFFETPVTLLFGNLGTLYDFLGVEGEIAPHVSIFGIMYLFGLVGLLAFSIFIIYYTKLVIRNLRRFRHTPHEFLTIALAVIWFTLMVISFFGGVYYSELVLLVTFVIAGSLFLKNKYVEERS